MNISYGYSFNFIEGSAPSPVPGGDIFSALTQTGDWLWIMVLSLFSIAALAICGILLSKKANLKSFSLSDVLTSKKAVVIIACLAFAIICVTTVTISSRALAEENHYDPSRTTITPVNVYVNKDTGEITADNFVVDLPDIAEDYYAIKIANPALRAGNGFENLAANVVITNQSQHFDIIDGCLNSMEAARFLTLKRNDVCSIDISGIDADTAKSLIGKNDVFYFIIGNPTTISQEDYKPDVELYVGDWDNTYNFDQVAQDTLKNEGWRLEDNCYIKNMKVHTNMSDALSVFYSLISNEHITEKNGYVFVGFCDDDVTLSRTVEQTNYKGLNTCYVQKVFLDKTVISNDLKYILHLEDFNDVLFKLSPEGEVLAKEHGWIYNSEDNSLIKEHVSYDEKPFDVVKLFNSENVLCTKEKTYFNYWSVMENVGIPSNLSSKLFCVNGSVDFFVESWTEEEANYEAAPAEEAAASEAAVEAPAATDVAVTEEVADEAVKDEAVAVDELPVVDQIIDYVTEELPEVATPLVLMLLWFL